MKNKLLIVGTVVVSLALTGCAGKTTLKNGEEVVASIDGKDFTAEQLYEKMVAQNGSNTLVNMIDEYILNKEYETDDDAKTYADSNIESYKSSYESYGQDFEQALKDAGYANEDEFKESLILDYKKKLVTEAYVKDQITEDEIESYYNDNVYGDIEAKHILITPEHNDNMTDDEIKEAENKAKEEAEELIKKIKNGEDFEKLAKEYSDDKGTASKGGKLTVTYGDVVDEFWDATYKLEDGKYTTEPVKSEYGYHIIFRDSQKAKPKLSEVKEDVIEKIVDKKIDADTSLQNKAMVAKRKEYKLEINDKNMKKSYNKTVENIEKSSNN